MNLRASYTPSENQLRLVLASNYEPILIDAGWVADFNQLATQLTGTYLFGNAELNAP